MRRTSVLRRLKLIDLQSSRKKYVVECFGENNVGAKHYQGRQALLAGNTNRSSYNHNHLYITLLRGNFRGAFKHVQCCFAVGYSKQSFDAGIFHP